MADNGKKNIVEAMVDIVGEAKDIYKKEPITYLTIFVHLENGINYLCIETRQVDSDFNDQWGSVRLDNKEEVEIARKLLRRVRFGREYVEFDKEGDLEIYVKDSPRLQKIRNAVDDLKYGKFYDELHREDEGYTVITKDVRGLKEFQKRHSDVVSVYGSDFGRDLFYVYIS